MSMRTVDFMEAAAGIVAIMAAVVLVASLALYWFSPGMERHKRRETFVRSGWVARQPVNEKPRRERGAQSGSSQRRRPFAAGKAAGADFQRDPKRFAREQRRKMTNSLRYDVMYRDGFRCQICGATAQDGAKLHVDHIVPVSRGGKTEMSNLRTLCARCNLGKGAKLELPVERREAAALPYDPYDGDPYDTGEPYDANQPL